MNSDEIWLLFTVPVTSNEIWLLFTVPVTSNEIWLLFTVPVTSNASRHFKSPLAMGEMPFKIKRASSVPISVVIDTGVNSNEIYS